MKTRLIAAAVAVTFAGGCDRKIEPPALPADMHKLMVEKVEPSAKTYWNAVQYISDETGFHEIMPRSDAEWARTREAAERVGQYAEIMNSPAFAEGRGRDWQDFAQGLSDVAGQAAKAAEEKNVGKVLEAGGTMYNVCSACHEVYLPLAGGQPPANTESAAGS